MSNSEDGERQVWQPDKHCIQLDGVRGLAILVVLIYRFTKEIPTDHWLGSGLRSGLLFGIRGVDLFFVLSGFLITIVLLQSKGKTNYFKRFYWRRSLRIFPLYFIALFALLVVAPAVLLNNDYPTELSKPLLNQEYLWTYSSNLYMAYCGQWNFGAMDHFWSLCVEEHFYFIWPVVIFALPNRWSLIAALAIAMSSAIARTGFAYLGTNRVATDVFTLFRMDGLCFGAALAIAMIEFPEWVKKQRTWMKIGLMASFLMGLAVQVCDYSLLAASHLGWSVIWTLFLGLLVTSRSTSTLARICQTKLLRNFGKYSYAMYVVQLPQITLVMPVISVAIIAAWVPNAILAVFLYALIMMALNYCLALLSWNCLEKHCLKLKDAFFKDKPASMLNPQGVTQSAAKINLPTVLPTAK